MSVQRLDSSTVFQEMTCGSLLLTPNNRIAAALNDDYASKQDNISWIAPQLKPVDIWIKELWQLLASRGVRPCSERTIVNRSEEFILWSSVVEDSLHKYPLLNPEETASQLARSYQDLAQYSVNEDQLRLRHFQTISDVAIYTQWQNSFQQLCSKHKLIPLVDAVREISSLLKHARDLIPKKVLLVNFFQTPALYQQLFDSLSALDDAQSRKVLAVDLLDSDSGNEPVQVAFNGADEELQTCANWALTFQSESRDFHLGIISNIDDEQRRKLERLLALQNNPSASSNLLSSHFQTVNKSTSDDPAFETGLVYSAFQILAFNKELQDSEKFCSLLQSPFMAGKFSEENTTTASTGEPGKEMGRRIELERYLRGSINSSIKTSSLIEIMGRHNRSYHCPELAKSILQIQSLQRSHGKSLTSRQWSELFSKQLEAISWPGTQLSRGDRDSLKAWHRILEEFAQCSRILGKVDVNTALHKLKSLTHGRNEGSAFNKACQVSLLSPTEAVGLQFDHIWFLNFNDKNWPGEAKPSAFLPFQLQKELCIPGATGEIQHQIATQQFHILCRSAKTSVTASYHRFADDQEFRPSHSIAGLRAQEKVEEEHTLAAEKLPALLYQVIEDGKPALRSTERGVGGHSIISDQSDCPFRSFANHRLHSEELEEFQYGLSAKARGTAIHIGLEFMYKEIAGRNDLATLNQQAREQLVSSSAAQAVTYLTQQFPEIVSPRYAEIEQQRIESLYSRFLNEEIERPEFTTVAQEQKQSWDLPRPQDAGTDEKLVKLNLKIDRIDKLADGSFALIDYKTGKKAFPEADWLKERPSDMQLPVYYVAASNDFLQQQASNNDDNNKDGAVDVSAIAIAHLNAEKIGYSGINHNDSFFPQNKSYTSKNNKEIDWQEYTQHWTKRVTQLATDFSRGEARVDPINPPSTCTYCKLNPLCRIRELNREFDLSDDADGEDGDLYE